MSGFMIDLGEGDVPSRMAQEAVAFDERIQRGLPLGEEHSLLGDLYETRTGARQAIVDHGLLFLHQTCWEQHLVRNRMKQGVCSAKEP